MKLTSNTTSHTKPADRQPRWLLVDAANGAPGRIGTFVAELLMGKGKADFSNHQLSGDYVVVINAAQMNFDEKKLAGKEYHHHTGYPGGLRTKTLGKRMDIHPDKVFTGMVSLMLPKNKLRYEMLKRLFVYTGAEHPHIGQQPVEIKLK